MPKKKDKVKLPPPPPPTEADYMVKLKIISTQAAKARSDAKKLENINESLREKLLNLENFRADIKLHLVTNIQEKDDAMLEIEEETVHIHKSLAIEKKQCAAKVKQIEIDFKKTDKALKTDIAILRAKLDSLEEFRCQRKEFMSDLYQQEVDFKRNEKLRREKMDAILMGSIGNRENVINEFNSRLKQLMDDLEKTYKVRVAGYSRKLTRENVTLVTTLDKLLIKQAKMEDKHKNICKKYKNLIDKQDVDNLNSRRLERTCEKQVDIIKGIKIEYEKIKVKHFHLLKFKELYEKELESDVCNKMAISKIIKRPERFEESIAKAQQDVDEVTQMIEKDIEKIHRFTDKIQIIKEIVERTIEKENIVLKRRKILLKERYLRSKKLCETISEILYSDGLFTAPSDMRLSALRIKSAQYKSLDDMEVLDAKPDSTPALAKRDHENIIPVERDIGPTTLMDAESGTPYIYTSSEEILPAEDEGMGEVEDFGASSSESAQGMPDEEEKLAVSSVIHMRRKSESIISSEHLDYEEEDDLFEDYGEDEDEIQFFY